MESAPPVEDDMIVISSPLHQITSVCFRLTNKNRALKNFNARFTPESDAEFAISPKTGILEPLGSDGTKFTISFTPVEYGKTRQAKLIIETEEIYWSYTIKGILPKYIPPVKESVLSKTYLQLPKANDKTREEKELLEDEEPKVKKNFIAKNIRSTREESKIVHEEKEREKTLNQS